MENGQLVELQMREKSSQQQNHSKKLQVLKKQLVLNIGFW
jgi:hypothetical protein